MTEAERLACTDPRGVLHQLGVSDRKCRLWALACCRRLQDRFGDPRVGLAFTLAERCIDGLVSEVVFWAVVEPLVLDAASLHNARRLEMQGKTGRDPNGEVAYVVKTALEATTGNAASSFAHHAAVSAAVAVASLAAPELTNAHDVPAFMVRVSGSSCVVERHLWEPFLTDRLRSSD